MNIEKKYREQLEIFFKNDSYSQTTFAVLEHLKHSFRALKPVLSEDVASELEIGIIEASYEVERHLELRADAVARNVNKVNSN